jgi:hypothetical protein
MSEFIDDRSMSGRSTEPAGQKDFTNFPQRDRRPLRVLLIGQPQDVSDTIKNLHRRGFTQADEWSRPAPWAATETSVQAQFFTLPIGSVMSVCTKQMS